MKTLHKNESNGSEVLEAEKPVRKTSGLNSTYNTEKKIEKLNERMKNMVQISFEKAVAHYEAPQTYPLPAGNRSIEYCFYDLISSLPKSKRNKVIDKINQTLKADLSQRTNVYKDLAGLNFKSSASISEQVKELGLPEGLKIIQEDTEIIQSKYKIIAGKNVKRDLSTRQVIDKAEKISFFVDNMTCLNPDDLHKDEINLAAFGIDTAGNTVNVTPFFIGKFRKNETVLLGDKNRLFTLNIDAALQINNFIAGLFIVEKDLISNDETVRKLSLLFTAIGTAIAVTMLALIVISVFVAPVITVTFAYIMSFASATFLDLGVQFIPLMADDISLAATDTFTIDGSIAVGDVFDRTLQIGKGFDIASTFDGKYTAVGRWVGE